MFRAHPSARQAFTAGVAILLMVPLVQAGHHHGADHSGGILHIETDHGGHELAPPKFVDGQISSGFSPLAVPGVIWTLPDPGPSQSWAPPVESVEHRARPPPPPLHSRAPPSSYL